MYINWKIFQNRKDWTYLTLDKNSCCEKNIFSGEYCYRQIVLFFWPIFLHCYGIFPHFLITFFVVGSFNFLFCKTFDLVKNKNKIFQFADEHWITFFIGKIFIVFLCQWKVKTGKNEKCVKIKVVEIMLYITFYQLVSFGTKCVFWIRWIEGDNIDILLFKYSFYFLLEDSSICWMDWLGKLLTWKCVIWIT